MLLSLHCEEQQLLFDVQSFVDLKHQAQDAFGHLLYDGLELLLQYVYHDDKITVQCQTGFETFLKVAWNSNGNNSSGGVQTTSVDGQNDVPFLVVSQGRPLQLPVAESDGEVSNSASPARSAAGSRDVRETIPSGQHMAVDADEMSPSPARKAKKSAGPARRPHPSTPAAAKQLELDDDNDVDECAAPTVASRKAQPRSAAVGSGVADVYYPEAAERKMTVDHGKVPFTQPQSAMKLLESFIPIEPEEPPYVFAIMRDGSHTEKVPFDPFNPPVYMDLVKRVERAYAGYIAKERKNGGGVPVTGGGVCDPESIMQLSVTCPQSSISGEFDIDDRKDVAMLAQILRDNGDGAAHILVEFAPPPSLPAMIDEEVGTLTNGGGDDDRSPSRFSNMSGMSAGSASPCRRPLAFNIAHTPNRSTAVTPVSNVATEVCIRCLEHVDSSNKCSGPNCGAYLHKKCAREGNLCTGCWTDAKRRAVQQ